MRPTRDFVETGLAWLGRVPASWQVVPLRHLVDFRSGGTPSKDRQDFWNGDIPWASAKDLKTDILHDTIDHLDEAAVRQGGVQLLPEQTVVVLVRGMMLAKTFPVARLAVPMAINQDLKGLLPRTGVDAGFLAWALRGTTLETLNRLDETGHGTKALRMDAWISMQFALPPHSEQTAIAAFLDRETAKIDTLVAAQRRLIELLKEKRHAVVSHAVTKGLNPSAPMKDSGVEWLGQVPAHWAVRPIRKLAKLESGHTPSRSKPEYWEDCTVPWFTLADVWQIREAKRDKIFETKEFVSEHGLANSSARLLPEGTVMLSRTASVGFSAIMGVPMATTQDFANWICGPRLLPDFLLLCLRGMTGEFRRLMMGSTHNTIYMPDIETLTIAAPPIEEQANIVRDTARKSGRYDALIAEAGAAVALLQERRAALISAAVTGKIDIQAQKPVVAADRDRVRLIVAAAVVERLAHRQNFGRVKLQKLIYLAETHAGISELDGNYLRAAAGPLDRAMIEQMEVSLEQSGRFAVSQVHGRGGQVSYRVLGGQGAFRDEARSVLKEREAKLAELIDTFTDLDTKSTEAVATLYGAWNDLLQDGAIVSDDAVVTEVLSNWHPEKAQKFKKAELLTWLQWMRRQGLTPRGVGPRTTTGRLFT